MPLPVESALVLVVLLATTSPPAPSPSPAVGADRRPRITLRWSTSSEVDNYGFHVMRAEQEKGPFVPVNGKPVPGAGNSDTTHDYVYEDFEVQPGKTYFYYLESISMQGVREKFSPVAEKTCCTPPSPMASPSPAKP